MVNEYWEQFDIVEYETPQYEDITETQQNVSKFDNILSHLPMFSGIVLFVGLVILGVSYKMFFQKIKQYFINSNKIKKVFCFLSIVFVLCVIYQLFFRYEYKVQNNGRKIIKIDKLTGKSTYTIPERDAK